MEKSNNKITTMDELNKIAPELSKIKKENPFRVPENYFEDFSARLQERLEAEKKGVPVKQSRVIQFLKPAIGLAAGFALIFTLSYWPLRIFTPNEQVENKTVEYSESEMLYASWVEGIDENSFYAMLDNPNGSVDFTDDDLADFVSTNSSEYEIYSQTNN
ncbi:MAG: hypothetical protein EP310_06430 [Bacteroidetes bacterium]|nr:MAG: hypothetical protein EP310_06430 [Bacteroidota bacterium]